MSGPYHPVFVHFPIALYFVGLLLTASYLWRKKPEDDYFAYRAFLWSLISAIIASLAGLVDRGQLAYDDPRTPELNLHITYAVLFIIFSGLVVYCRFRWPDILQSSQRWWYLTLIFIGAVMITVAGWSGGELVYKWGIGIR
ncbi:MAG: DUF2231 domain-containing protein [Chloroflexota bacterium]